MAWSNDFRAFSWFYWAFAAAIGLAYIAGRFVPAFPVTFIVAETGEPATVPFSIVPVVEIVLLGPVFCVTSWHAFSMLKANVHDADWIRVTIPVLQATYVACMTIVMAGGAFHGLANHLHALAKDAGLLATHPVLFHAIYFWDELLSHYLIPGGFFGMLLVNAAVDSREANLNGKLAVPEAVATGVMAAALGTGWAYALLEGQAAWLYAIVLCGILVGIAAIKVATLARQARGLGTGAKWRLTIWNNPFVLLAVVAGACIVAITLAWAIAFGVKPHLPFLYQPSELFP